MMYATQINVDAMEVAVMLYCLGNKDKKIYAHVQHS